MKSLSAVIKIATSCIFFAVTGFAFSADVVPPSSTEAQESVTTPAEPARVAKHRAAPDSLMFTPDEFADIQTRSNGPVNGEAESDGRQPIEDATLYLSTILYAGPNDWTIWINGAPVSANQGFKAFQVTEITPNSVDLLVPLSAQGMRPVHLQPNQTFVTKTGVVVEGKYP